VTSARKRKSNRANARSSTGPKTARGRARSAGNALRFGLSLSVLSDPTLRQEVEALAGQIAGTNASPEIRKLARRVAEPQIDLRRVRSLRLDLISRALADPDFDFRANRNKKVTVALRIIYRCCRCEDIPAEDVRLLESKLEGPDKFITILTEIARRLPALDRYERRALSRRKLAIRAFDVGRSNLAEAVRPDTAERHTGD
jgi:hypothetical protein